MSGLAMRSCRRKLRAAIRPAEEKTSLSRLGTIKLCGLDRHFGILPTRWTPACNSTTATTHEAEDPTAPPRKTHCLPDRGFVQEPPKVRYPLLTFGGRIVYSRTIPEVEKATSELLEVLQAKGQKADNISVGFDAEWKPTFKKGGLRKAAVIQLCAGTSHCHVMHIIHSGIPPILESFLKNDSFTKVGVSIADDATKILKDYNVHVQALHDLSSFANLKLGGAPKQWSLRSLTETLACKHLAKSKKIRMGNWEVGFLSNKQLEYAATDAFASWYLYEALKKVPGCNHNVEQVSGFDSS